MERRMDRAIPEPQVELRPARADDVPAILALWRTAGLFPSMMDDADSVRGLIARDAEALLLAEIGGEVRFNLWDVGRLAGQLLPACRPPRSPTKRHRAEAGRSRGTAERRIGALGGRTISSIVVGGDEHAVAFWRAAGYERDDRVSRFVKGR